MSLKLIFEVFEIISLVSFGFLVISIVIPVGNALGSIISDIIERFLRSFR